jgi:hypothetical protein
MTADYVDTKKLSTHVAQRAIDRLFDFAEAKIKEKWAKHKNKNITLFANYIEAQAKRCARVRTLVYDRQSANLPDIYVPLRGRLHSGYGRKSRSEDLRVCPKSLAGITKSSEHETN